MNLFRLLRENAGMSVDELAQALDVAPSYVTAQESGPSGKVDYMYAVNASEACGVASATVLHLLEDMWHARAHTAA